MRTPVQAASLSLRPLRALAGSSVLEQAFVFCPEEATAPHTEAARVHLRRHVNLNFEHTLDGLPFCLTSGLQQAWKKFLFQPGICERLVSA